MKIIEITRRKETSDLYLYLFLAGQAVPVRQDSHDTLAIWHSRGLVTLADEAEPSITEDGDAVEVGPIKPSCSDSVGRAIAVGTGVKWNISKM